MLQTPNVASQSSREEGNSLAMVNNQEQNTQPNPPVNPSTSWSSLFQGGLNVWRDYVVGFFLEQRLPYPVIKEALKKKWRTKGDYEMVADTELFYFKFSNEEDKRKVLENSPIYIAGKYFIVTQWTQDIEKRKSTVKAIPIWVNLRAKEVNAEGVDRTEGNPNEVSMADLCLSAIAVESEGVLRRTDETSMVAENEEGIVATEESTLL
ncbi:hypothetical protein IFM89_008815 [Coptis chinensis]|uniref:DUF4283 domain-containing protein n=1 Tax=Coptis chinensis TaxID=261450 RepID=A0A835LLW1_9MAGN|nr:hypothetical protein IFM89_008815 [Coptis chinensis]